MRSFREAIRSLLWWQVTNHYDHQETMKEQILYRLRQAHFTTEGDYKIVPRGYFKSISDYLGCSDAYVSVTAKNAGYKVAGRAR